MVSEEDVGIMTKEQDWTRRVQNSLESKFGDAPRWRSIFGLLWQDHLAAGLACEQLVVELCLDSRQAFLQRVWEMALGRHLRACGHQVFLGKEGQPDFYFFSGNTKVWVEATSPSPGVDLPEDWVVHNPSKRGSQVGTVPHEEILRRWTGGFIAKSEAKKRASYIRNGVSPSDAFVVAIDGSQLGYMALAHGISRAPYIAEAVFPLGPLAFSVDRDTGKIGDPILQVRFSIKSRNDANIPTTAFLDKHYSGVSAVLGCASLAGEANILPIQVVHNPLAEVPIGRGTFGMEAEEWGAVLDESGGEAVWDIGMFGKL